MLSGLEARTKSSKVWTRKATPAGRSWWVLTTLARHSDASESGSWGTPRVTTNGGTGNGDRLKGSRLEDQACWPTPTAQNANGNAQTSENPTPRQTGGTTLPGAVMRSAWPTPTAEDSRASGAAGYSTDSGRHAGTTLTDAARGQWATPTTKPERTNRGGAAGKVGPKRSLLIQAEMWATPTARDWRSGLASEETHDRNARPLNEQVSREWMTPRTNPAGGERMMRGNPTLLGQAIQLSPEESSPDQASDSTSGKRHDWPTPTARDDHGPGPNHTKGGTDLPKTAGATGRGSLNPKWVSQLQGLPDGWLDSNPPDDALGCARSATRSIRKRSQRSDAQS